MANTDRSDASPKFTNSVNCVQKTNMGGGGHLTIFGTGYVQLNRVSFSAILHPSHFSLIVLQKRNTTSYLTGLVWEWIPRGNSLKSNDVIYPCVPYPRVLPNIKRDLLLLIMNTTSHAFVLLNNFSYPASCFKT